MAVNDGDTWMIRFGTEADVSSVLALWEVIGYRRQANIGRFVRIATGG